MNSLENLRDIHLPEPVTFWPPAIGWWFVIGLLLLLLIGSVLFWHYRYKPMRYKRQALKTLENLHKNAISDEAFADATARLVRQTALTKDPGLASSQGNEWQHYLARQMPDDVASDLAISRYQPDFCIDRERLYQGTKQWLRGLS